MKDNERKKVFISYSWDSPEHQEWVLNLSKNLIEKFGVDVILDQFELSAGKDLTYFMEKALEMANKVLVILTPNYKIKAENRERGVGYEASMISQEVFKSSVSTVKFIPILREGNLSESSPKFLKSKLYLQMDDDEKYISKLYELYKIIYDRPLVEKPNLGKIPDFKTDSLDPIIDIAIAVSREEELNNEINALLNSKEGVDLFRTETEKLTTILSEKIELYRKDTKLPFNHQLNKKDSYIISILNYSISFYWHLPYSNTIIDSELVVIYWNGIAYLNNGYYIPKRDPKKNKEIVYNLDMNYSKELIWKNGTTKLSTIEIVQKAFLYLMENVQREKSKNFRK